MFFLLLPFGCRQRDVDNDNFVTVDILNTALPKKEVILQDFMEVEYIKLETTDDFVTQGVVRAIGKDIILVTNQNRLRDGTIYVFDKTGKPLRKINRMGQGGEEYSNIMEIILIEDKNEMYIHNHYERKIQVYDLFGNFKRSLKYKENTNGAFYTDIVNYDENHLICYDAYNKERAFALISKENGSIVRKIEIPYKDKKFFRQVDVSGEHYAFPDPFLRIIPYNGDMLLLEHSSDTVYTFSPDFSLDPFLARTPSIQSMDPEIFLVLRCISESYYFIETVKNVFDFSKNKGFPKKYLMYDKRHKSFFEYKAYNGDYSTKQEVFMSVFRLGNNEGEYYYRLEASQLVEAYEKGILKGKLKEIAATLDEESNPVIMLVGSK